MKMNQSTSGAWGICTCVVLSLWLMSGESKACDCVSVNSPVSISATLQTNGSVLITWDWSKGDGDDAEGFKIYRREYGGIYQLIGSTGETVRGHYDSSAEDEKHYEYEVRAYCGQGVESSGAIPSDVYTDMRDPTNVVISNHALNPETKIDVSWTDHSEVDTQYYVQHSRYFSGQWEAYTGEITYAGNGATTGNWIVTKGSLLEGNQYKIRVRAEWEEDNFTEWVESNSIYTWPNAPSTLTMEENAPTSLSLRFIDTSDYEENFRIYYRNLTTSGEWAYHVISDHFSTGFVEADLPGLEEGQNYEIYVVATTDGGAVESKQSNSISVWTRPEAPSNLTVEPYLYSDATLTWTDNSTLETGYRIEVRSMPNGGQWSEYSDVGTTGSVASSGNATSYWVTGLEPSYHHEFRVSALNGGNAPSTSTSITTRMDEPPTLDAFSLAIYGEPDVTTTETYTTVNYTLNDASDNLDQVEFYTAIPGEDPYIDEAPYDFTLKPQDSTYLPSSSFCASGNNPETTPTAGSSCYGDTFARDQAPPFAPTAPAQGYSINQAEIFVEWDLIQDQASDFMIVMAAIDESGLESNLLPPQRTFESGSDQDGLPYYGFTEIGSAGNCLIVSNQDDHATTAVGYRYLQLQSPSAETLVQVGLERTAAQVNSEVDFYVTAYQKATSAGATVSLEYTVDGVTWLSAGGEGSVSGNGGDQWEIIGFYGHLPEPNYQKLRLVMDNVGNQDENASVYYDDLSLREVRSSTILSGVKGYQIEISSSSTPRDPEAVYRENFYGQATSESMILGNLSNGILYGHIRAYDYANNLSSWTTLGSWEIDTIPPNVPQLVDVLDENARSEGYIGASADALGRQVVHPGEALENVTLHLIAMILGHGSAQLGSTVASTTETLLILNDYTGLTTEGQYIFWLYAEDDFTPSNFSSYSAPAYAIVDHTPPDFQGLTSIAPSAHQENLTDGHVDLTWELATDNYTQPYDILYEVYATTGTDLVATGDLITTLTVEVLEDRVEMGDVLIAEFVDVELQLNEQDWPTTVVLTLDVDRAHTRRWGVRAVDLANNGRGLETPRILYGDDDFALAWNEGATEASDWATTLSLSFTPDVGSTSTATMRIFGSDIEVTDQLSHSWQNFLTPAGPLVLRLTGLFDKQIYAQVRDEAGNYSFIQREEIHFVEPPVLWSIDLYDRATSASLAQTIDLISQDVIDAELVGLDQYGDFFPIDGALFNDTISDTPEGVISLQRQGELFTNYWITGQKIGLAKLAIKHNDPAKPQLQTSRFINVTGAGPLARIEIDPPGPEQVISSGMRHFTAQGFDGADNRVEFEPAWSTQNIGSINPYGTLRAITTDGILADHVRVEEREGNPAVFAEVEVEIDGRAPIVEAIQLTPGAGLSGLTTGVQDLKIQIPVTPPAKENALPALYLLYLDGILIGEYTQYDHAQALLGPAVALDTERLRPGMHELKVLSSDRLGNTNVESPYRQWFEAEGGAPSLSAVDWLLEWENLDPDRPEQRGTWWTQWGRNPSLNFMTTSNLATYPEDELAAAVQESAAAVITLLDYRLDYVSKQINPTVGDYVSVHQAIGAAASFLYTMLKEEVVQDPLVRMIALEALAGVAERPEIVVSYVDWDRNQETAVGNLHGFVVEAVRAELVQDRSGGFTVGDVNGASRLATLSALRLACGMEDEFSDVLGEVYIGEGSESILEYLGNRVDYANLSDAINWIAEEGGWGVNQWDRWNEARSVYVTAELLRTLVRFEKIDGLNPQLETLKTQARDFLLGRLIEPPLIDEGIGIADPATQNPGDLPTTPTVVATAVAALALNDAGMMDPTTEPSIMEAIEYLYSEQETDHSWRHRGYDTALVMRLLRPDLLIQSVGSPVTNPQSGQEMYPVQVRNVGIRSTGDSLFVVSAYESNPESLSTDQLQSMSIGMATCPVELGPATGTTTVNVPIDQETAQIYFMVDGHSEIAELNESNNIRRIVTGGLPDLMVSPEDILFGRYESGQFQEQDVFIDSSWAMKITVWNRGNAPVPAGYSPRLALYRGDYDTGHGIEITPGFFGINTLDVDESQEVILEFPADSTAVPGAGVYLFSAVIDNDGLEEWTTGNNQAMTAEEVFETPLPALPDLMIEAVDVSVSSPTTVGGSTIAEVTVNVAIGNQGAVSVTDPLVELSINGAPFRTEISSGELAEGGILEATFEFTAQCPGVSLGIEVDPTNGVLESNESNNFESSVAAIPCAGIYDLSVANEEISLRNSGWSVEAIVRNNWNVSYTGEVDPLPLLTGRSKEHETGNITPFLNVQLDQPIDVGEYLVHQWPFMYLPRDVDGTTHTISVAIENNDDATTLNNYAQRDFVLYEDPIYLSVANLTANPSSAVIDSAFEPGASVEFSFDLTNGSNIALENVKHRLLAVDQLNGDEILLQAGRDDLPTQTTIHKIARHPLAPGTYEVILEINPDGRILEADPPGTSDNSASIPVRVSRAEDPDRLPDLRFAADSIALAQIGDLVNINFDIINALDDDGTVPMSTGSFVVSLVDPMAGDAEITSRTVSMLAGGERLGMNFGVQLTSASADLCLVIDSADDVEERDEANNVNCEVRYYQVPPPVNGEADSSYGQVNLEWENNSLIGGPEYMTIDELEGYWVRRYRKMSQGSIKEEQYFVSAHPDPSKTAYALSDPVGSSHSEYMYQIETAAENGLRSQAMSIEARIIGAPAIEIHQDQKLIEPGDSINVIRAEDLQATIHVEIENVDGVELYMNGEPLGVTTDPNEDGRYVTHGYALSVGINRFQARAFLHQDDGVTKKYGPFSVEYQVTASLGVDLTYGPSPVYFSNIFWQQVNPNHLLPGELFYAHIQLRNRGTFDSSLFSISCEMHADNGVTPYTSSFSNLRPLSNGWLRMPLRKPTQDFQIHELVLKIDDNNEILETNEQNNTRTETIFRCSNYTDVMIVLDRSGSMSNRIGMAREHLYDLIIQDLAYPIQRVGMVSFNSVGDLEANLDDPTYFPVCKLIGGECEAIGPLGGTSIRNGLSTAHNHFVSGGVRQNAIPIMLLVDDATSLVREDLRRAIQIKRDMYERYVEGDTDNPLRIYNLHIGGDYEFSNEGMLMRMIASTFDVEVMLGSQTTGETLFVVENYGANYGEPIDLEGSAVLDIPSAIFSYSSDYLFGSSVVKTSSDVTNYSADAELASFYTASNLPYRVIVLYRQDKSTPDWLSGWSIWNSEARYKQPGNSIALSNYVINGVEYETYFKQFSAGSTFRLYGAPYQYFVFVQADPTYGADPVNQEDQYDPYFEQIVSDPDSYESAFNFFFQNLCDPEATYYDLAVGLSNETGFKDGDAPRVGEDGMIERVITNLGEEPCHQVQYRFTIYHFDGETSSGWLDVADLPINDDGLSVLGAGQSATVEFPLNDIEPGTYVVKLETMYAEMVFDINLGDNTSVIHFDAEYIGEYAWEAPFTANNVGLVPNSQDWQGIISVRIGQDRSLNLTAGVSWEGMFWPDIEYSVSNNLGVTTEQSMVLDYDNPTSGVCIVDCPIQNFSSTTSWPTTFDLRLNYTPIYREANHQNNEATVTLDYQWLYQDAAITTITHQTTRLDGAMQLDVGVARVASENTYLFDSVTVGLFRVDQTSGQLSALSGMSQRVSWGQDDPSTQTISFFWRPAANEDQFTIRAIADPYEIELYEHPNGGRDNNHQDLTITRSDYLNLSPNRFVLENNNGIAIETIESGQESWLELDSLYTAGADAPSSVTYKVRFWDGHPLASISSPIADLPVENHSSTESIRQHRNQWLTADLFGTHRLYAEIDPANHFASAATNPASRIPLELATLWAENPLTLEIAKADQANEGWSVQVLTVDAEDPTSSGLWTVLGEYSSSGTLQHQAVASSGPVLLVFQTIDTDGQPADGDEWLPEISTGDTLTLYRADEFTTATQVDEVVISLPATKGQQLRALALWVAEDGSTYFANSMHLLSDYNYGGGDLAWVDMSPTLAMTDAFGRVVEDDELDNLALIEVWVEEATTTDVAVTDVVVLGDSHPAGAPLDLDVKLLNQFAPQPHSFALQVFAGPDLEANPQVTVHVSGNWSSGEERRIPITLPTQGFTGTLPIRVRIELSDNNETNNVYDTQAVLTGSMTLTFSDPQPTVVGHHADVATTVGYSADPVTTGSVQIAIVNDRDQTMAVWIPEALSNLSIGEMETAPVAWHTGDIVDGIYRFEADLIDEATQAVRAHAKSTTFTIEALHELSVEAETDKTYYRSGELVSAWVTVGNPVGRADLTEPTTVTLELLREDGTLVQLDVEQTTPLRAGSESNLNFQYSNLNDDEYALTVTAENPADGGLFADDDLRFNVGWPGQIPAEQLELVDGLGSELTYTNDLRSSVTLGSLGDYVMTGQDYAWLNHDPRPMLSGNLVDNGDIGRAGSQAVEAAGWFAAAGEAPRTEWATNHWALELTSQTTAISQNPDPTEQGSRSTSIGVEPEKTYCLSFESGQTLASTLLSVEVREFTALGNAVGTTAVKWIESVTTDRFSRHEMSFTTAAATHYVDLVFTWNGTGSSRALVTRIQLQAGDVAGVYRNRVRDEWVNRIANGGFVIDSGLDLKVLQPDLVETSDQGAANLVPDGWINAGGGTTAIVTPTDLPTSLTALGVEHAVELTHDGTTTPALEQRYIPATPGESLGISLWHKGSGQLLVEQYDAAQATLITSDSLTLVGGDWTETSATLQLSESPAAHFVNVRLDSVSSGTSLRATALRLGRSSDHSDEWSGWLGYATGTDWVFDGFGADGPRHAHARYLTVQGDMAWEPMLALTRDADGDGISDVHAPMVSTLAVMATGSTETALISHGGVRDNDRTTSLSLDPYDSLDWFVDCGRMTHVDALRIAGDLATTTSVQVEGSLDGLVWLNVGEARELAPGEQDLLLAVEAAWPQWQVTLTPSEAATLSGTLTETELRGYLTSADDTVVIDRTAPAIQSLDDLPALTSELTVSGASSDSLSRVGAIEYRIGHGGDWLVGQTFESPAGLQAFDFTVPDLTEGEHRIEVRAVDRAGNVSTLVESTTTSIDLTLPTISLDEFLPDPTTLTHLLYTGTAADGFGGLDRVELRVDNGSWQTADSMTTTTGAFSHTVTITTDSLYVVQARAIDKAGNVSTPAYDLVRVDTTGPVLNIAYPSEGQWYNTAVAPVWWSWDEDIATSEGLAVWTSFTDPSATASQTIHLGDALTSDGLFTLSVDAVDWLGNVGLAETVSFKVDLSGPSVTLTAYAPDPTSETTIVCSGTVTDANASGVASVEVSLDGQPWTPAENWATTSSVFTHTLSDLSEGEHTLIARAWDHVGNVSAISTDTVTVDTTGPVMRIDSPATGTLNNAAATVWSTLAGDLRTSHGVALWTAWDDPQTTATWPVVSGDAVTTDGLYQLDVWGVDLAGNVGPTTSTQFRFDATAPSIALDTHNSTSQSTVLRTGTTHDWAMSGVTTVTLSVDGGAWQIADNWTSSAGNFSHTFAGLSDGEHLFAAQATDAAGNTTITTDTVAVDTTAPVMTIVSPEAGWTSQSALLNWVASETLATSQGTLLWTDTDQANTASYAVADGDLATTEGSYVLSVWGEDLVGLSSAATSRSFGLDLTTPTAVLTAVAPDPTSQTTAMLSGTVADPYGAGVAAVELSLDGGPWQPAADWATTSTIFSHEWTGLNEGLHTAQLRSIDGVGWTSQVSSDTFLVDLTSPVVTLTDYAPDPTSQTTLVWSGTVSDGAGSGIASVEASVNGEAWTEISWDPATGATTPAADASAADGAYTMAVRATDAAGNVSLISTDTVTVDTTGPVMTLTTPDAATTLTGIMALEVSAQDEAAGIDWVKLRFEQNNEVYWPLSQFTGTATSRTYTQSFDTTLLYDGLTTITLYGRDLLGNESWHDVQRRIDNHWPPMGITGLEGSFISYSEVELNWNLNTEPDFKEYRIYRDTSEDVGAEDRIALNETVTTATYIDDTVTTTSPGYYYYRLSAVDLSDNVSTWSEVLRIDAPAPPEDLRAIGRDSQVDLNWKAVPEGFVKGYAIYCKAEGEAQFSQVGSTSGRTAVSWTHTGRTNGTTYRYYVVSLDGADNESLPSNQVEAVPGVIPNMRTTHMVAFEDLENQGSNDWDFNDIAFQMKAILYLTSYDEVSTVSLINTATDKDAGHTHEVYVDFHAMVGSGTVQIKRYDSSSYTNPKETENMTYVWEGTSIPIFKNTSTGVTDGDGSVLDDRVIVTMELSNPTGNPLGDFDLAPFDTWIYVTNTGQDSHIFDPTNGDHAADNQVVQLGESDPLNGVYLSFGLAIPRDDWEAPSSKQKLWAKYPQFEEYARSIRNGGTPVNLTWYDYPN